MNIKITEWDETPGGYIFEIQQGLGMAYVKRLNNGTYQHFDANFTRIELTNDAASKREIAVASYIANNSHFFAVR